MFRQKLRAGFTSGFRTITERAAGRGELAAHADVELMASLLIVLVHDYRVLTGKPAGESLARRIAGKFFSAASPRASVAGSGHERG